MISWGLYGAEAERQTWGRRPGFIQYCFRRALLGGICELLRMKASWAWRRSRRRWGRHCANFPPHLQGLIYCRMNGFPGLPISITHRSCPWCSFHPLLVRREASFPLVNRRDADLHWACYFSPGSPKVARLSSFVVFTHVPSGLGWAVKNKALERQMVSGGCGGERREKGRGIGQL